MKGQLVRYRPPTSDRSLSPREAAATLERSANNPLGIPEPRDDDLNRLFKAFAPVFEVDVVAADDRIGTPIWSTDRLPTVDVSRAVVYRRVSYTRFESRILLQLNYVTWFPARTRTGDFDLLAQFNFAVDFFRPCLEPARLVMNPVTGQMLFGDEASDLSVDQQCGNVEQAASVHKRQSY